MENILTTTANGRYLYNTIYQGEQLVNLLKQLIDKLCLEDIKIGTFEYDNLAVCIGYVFENINGTYSLSDIKEIILEVSNKNYQFWKINKPWEKDNRYVQLLDMTAYDRTVFYSASFAKWCKDMYFNKSIKRCLFLQEQTYFNMKL